MSKTTGENLFFRLVKMNSAGHSPVNREKDDADHFGSSGCYSDGV